MPRRDHVTILLGKRRSGKTTLLKGSDPLEAGILDWTQHDRAFILDPREEWSEGLRFTPPNPICDLQQALRQESAGVWKTGFDRWIIHASHEQHIENFFRLMAPNQTTGKPGVPGLIVLDEASEYQSPHKVEPGLKRMIQLGGNDDQSIILAARFWTQLHRHIRQNANAIITFKGIHEDTIREWTKTIDKEAEIVYRLSIHEFTILGEQQILPFEEQLAQLESFVPAT